MRFFQTNHEGEYVEQLHRAADSPTGCSSTPARGRTTRGRSATRSRSPGCRRSRSTVRRRARARSGAASSVIARRLSSRTRQRARARRLPRRRSRARKEALGEPRATASPRALAERELDALLVTDLVNVRYLTGYTGSNGARGGRARTCARFITDFRYVERAGARGRRLRPRARAAGLLERARRRLARRARAARLRGRSTCRVRRTRGCASCCRRRRARARRRRWSRRCARSRSPREVERIRAAAELADEGYEWVRERGLAGRTEREVALALEERDAPPRRQRPELPVDRGLGRARRAAARRAARRRDRRAACSSRSTGARLDGYCSDCTRTWRRASSTATSREVYDARAAGAAGGARRRAARARPAARSTRSRAT